MFGEWGEKIAAEKGSIRSSSSQLEGQGAWKREELLVRQQRRHRHGLWVPVTKVCARRSTIYMHSNICRHTSASRTLIFMCGDFQTSTVWGGFCQMLGNPAVWSVDRPLGSSTLVAFQGYSRVIMVCFLNLIPWWHLLVVWYHPGIQTKFWQQLWRMTFMIMCLTVTLYPCDLIKILILWNDSYSRYRQSTSNTTDGVSYYWHYCKLGTL